MECQGRSNDSITGESYCDKVLVGGSGGCCSNYPDPGFDGSTRGFYVLTFDENGRLHAPYEPDSPVLRFDRQECGYCLSTTTMTPTQFPSPMSSDDTDETDAANNRFVDQYIFLMIVVLSLQLLLYYS